MMGSADMMPFLRLASSLLCSSSVKLANQLWQTVAVRCFVWADELHHPLCVMREDMHASEHECTEYGRGKFLCAERPQHCGMGKDVYGTTGSESGIPFATNAMRFAFVNQCNALMFYGHGNGGGLAVIEGLGGRTNNELFEVLCPYLAHSDDFHESVIDECLQMIGILAASSLAFFKLAEHRIGDHHSVRDGSKNVPRAA
jgi:hypothetical protein